MREGRVGYSNDIGAVATSLNYSNASVLLRVTLDYASVATAPISFEYSLFINIYPQDTTEFLKSNYNDTSIVPQT